ncbi:hypothetical protein CH063_07842 [Colletotrichum higginsianum]|uniref:Uncharacterized protein n=1 Tax=Colletotrichum higginsianum (strain IMI 349063) TaxID=759273 RepID=H1V7M2_COLHI|nr:hypothetical protein CH063_07842 [Colletotrichum higginsianum]
MFSNCVPGLNSYQSKVGKRSTADAGPTTVDMMVAKTRNPDSNISQGPWISRP